MGRQDYALENLAVPTSVNKSISAKYYFGDLKLTNQVFSSLTADHELKQDQVIALETKVNELVSMSKRFSRNKQLRLLKLYKYISENYLTNYKPYSLFSQTIAQQNYDCVTGTLLYAILLDRLGYSFTIYETNVHVFLVVNLKTCKILIESTDPKNGFIIGKSEVKEIIDRYKKQSVQQVDNKYFKSQNPIFNEITISQLSSLQYYNKAVENFNNKQYWDSLVNIDHAARVYSSSRNEELSMLCKFQLELTDKFAFNVEKSIIK